MVEQDLQPVTGESLRYRSAVTTDEARLDVYAFGWGDSVFKSLFRCVKVFNSYTKHFQKCFLPSVFSSLEQMKRRPYEQRICEIEHGLLCYSCLRLLVAQEWKLLSCTNNLAPYQEVQEYFLARDGAGSKWPPVNEV